MPIAVRARPVQPVRAGYETFPTDLVAVALLFLLCAQAIGPAVILGELALTGLLLASRWRTLASMAGRMAILLPLPLFAVASALWSDVPSVSLRYGLQLLLTLLIGISIAWTVPLRRLPLIVLVATGLASVIGVASGRTGPAVEGAVLIGLTGSKNQMGYVSLFWLISALAVLGQPGRGALARVVAFASLLPAFWLIVQGKAATAIVSAVVLTIFCLVLLVASALSRTGRTACLAAALAVSVVGVAAAGEISAAFEFVRTDVFHKDKTLTGRTLLWESADELIEERPLLGHGYRAIWLGKEGVGLLARVGQRDGRAFNFHDTIRDVTADLGYVGLSLLLLPIAFAATRLAALLVAETRLDRVFLALVLVAIGLRFRTELTIAPFLLDTVMLAMAVSAVLLDGSVQPNTAEKRAPPRPGPRRVPARSRAFARPDALKGDI